eukprot:2561756-Prymnesium_polylepis.1
MPSFTVPTRTRVPSSPQALIRRAGWCIGRGVRRPVAHLRARPPRAPREHVLFTGGVEEIGCVAQPDPCYFY